MIRTKEIRKSFGTLEVLKGIDLLVERGEVVSIVGPSGAGKTTLLQILGTLSRPSSGEIEIDGEAVHALSDRQLSRFRNTKIGFVFQFHHLLPEFTALENVCIPGYIGGRDRREVEKRAAELLEMLGMEHRSSHKPAELSGGEQQRARRHRPGHRQCACRAAGRRAVGQPRHEKQGGDSPAVFHAAGHAGPDRRHRDARRTAGRHVGPKDRNGRRTDRPLTASPPRI